MKGPERREPGALPSEERRRILRAAALRPINVLMLVIGAGFFATTLTWWIPPLTLVTYILLVALSARDPIFGHRVLHGGEGPARALPTGDRDVSPERRARWLPRGETREKVEAALVVYRKVVAAVEGSDEVTRGVLDDAVPSIRHHHERFDGAGYPDGLKGEEIPLGARIIHVADALDSMLTTRIYRAARPAMEAMDELKRSAGTQFCPRCVAALERILPAELLEDEHARQRVLVASA
jgi:hypothetical protein